MTRRPRVPAQLSPRRARGCARAVGVPGSLSAWLVGEHEQAGAKAHRGQLRQDQAERDVILQSDITAFSLDFDQPVTALRGRCRNEPAEAYPTALSLGAKPVDLLLDPALHPPARHRGEQRDDDGLHARRSVRVRAV